MDDIKCLGPWAEDKEEQWTPSASERAEDLAAWKAYRRHNQPVPSSGTASSTEDDDENDESDDGEVEVTWTPSQEELDEDREAWVEFEAMNRSGTTESDTNADSSDEDGSGGGDYSSDGIDGRGGKRRRG